MARFLGFPQPDARPVYVDAPDKATAIQRLAPYCPAASVISVLEHPEVQREQAALRRRRSPDDWSHANVHNRLVVKPSPAD